MKRAGAYVLTHPKTGLFYIGHTSDFTTRQKCHTSELNNGRSHIAKLSDVFQAGDDISWEFHPTATKDDALQLESDLIAQQASSESICNKHHAGYTLSDEHRQILSDYAKANPMSEESRRKGIIANTGRVMPRDAVERSRLANIGRKHTEETRLKMSSSHATNGISTEGRKKISEARSKEIILDDVKYKSATDAAIQLGVHRSTITQRLRRLRSQCN